LRDCADKPATQDELKQVNPTPCPPIDAVITWVDGDDPVHQQKLSQYLSGLPLTPADAQKTRFCSVNEIRYCVFSLLRFAPYFRNIFIVTDGQTPPVFEEVKRRFPDRLASLRLVDHAEIFRGFENYLPTFSSRSIETMLFRIDGLSENFVYLNDDVFLVGKTERDDWFIDGIPVLRGRWCRKPTAQLILTKAVDFLLRRVFSAKQCYVRSSYKQGQWEAARVVGFGKRYFWSDHLPRPMRKSVLQEFYSRHPSVLEKNASYRVRSPRQYNPQALAIHLELKRGNENRRNDNLVCFKPVNRRAGYVGKKLRMAEQDHVQFLCAQSLDLATPEDLAEIQAWLERVIIEGN
jgi:hypothetical protein